MDKADILQRLDKEIEKYETAVSGDSHTDYSKKLNFYAAPRSELDIMPIPDAYLKSLNDCKSIIGVVDKSHEFRQYLGGAKPDYTEFSQNLVEDIYTHNRADILWERLSKENEAFQEHLMSRPPKEIIAKAYEITIKEDILMLFEANNFTSRQIDALLCYEEPLAAIYYEWLDTDASHMDMLRDFIDTLIEHEVEYLLRHDYDSYTEKPSEDIQHWNALYEDNDEVLSENEAEDCEDPEQ